MKKRKLTVESLAELAKRMLVLSENMQRAYVGGSDPNDCWWRCIAYLESCGTDFSSDAAMAIASGYYGDKFDENSYAFSGNGYEHKNFASSYFSGSEGSHCNGQILVFDPNTTPGWSGNGTSKHAVIVTGYDQSGNMNVFDPQTGNDSTISQSDVSGAFIVNVK